MFEGRGRRKPMVYPKIGTSRQMWFGHVVDFYRCYIGVWSTLSVTKSLGHTGNSNSKFKLNWCSLCGRKCKSLLEYFRHQDSAYYGVRCIVCTICRDVFLSETMLVFHISEVHGGPILFKQQFSQKFLYK